MAGVTVTPGALVVETSLSGVPIISVNVAVDALAVATSLTGDPHISVVVNPGALVVATGLAGEQNTSVNVTSEPLSANTSLSAEYLFVGKSEITVSVYAGKQLKMTKVISTAPELSGDVIKREKLHTNVKGSHMTLQIDSEKLGRNMYLLDLNIVASIITGR